MPELTGEINRRYPAQCRICLAQNGYTLVVTGNPNRPPVFELQVCPVCAEGVYTKLGQLLEEHKASQKK